MKKQLLAGMLLFTTTITPIAQQPQQAKQLAHLKNVKADLEQQAIELDKTIKEFERGSAEPLVQFWDEVYNLEFFKKSSMAEVNCYFDIICNQMKTIAEMAEMDEEEMMKVMASYAIHPTTDPQELIQPLVKKYFEHDPVIKGSIDNLFQSQDNALVAMILNHAYITKLLLQKIDAKIKELEKKR